MLFGNKLILCFIGCGVYPFPLCVAAEPAVYSAATATSAATLATARASEELISAVSKGRKQDVARLLQDPNATDEKGRSLLQRAAFKGQAEIIDLLVEKKVDPDYVDLEGETALHMACAGDRADAVIRLLAVSKKSIMHANGKGLLPLHIASKIGNAVMIGLVLQAGTPVDAATTNTAQTALWIAAQYGNQSAVDVLLLNQARPDSGDMNQVTPLLRACYEGHLSVASRLLSAGANPNQPRDNGITALIIASYRGFFNIVRLLVENGAAVHYRTPEAMGRGKAIHYALQQKEYEIVNFLEAQPPSLEEVQQAQVLQRQLEQLTENVAQKEEEQTRVPTATSAILAALAQELTDIKKQHYMMLKAYESKNLETSRKQYLKDTSTREGRALKTFYEMLTRKLGEIFLGYKTIDSGLVERETMGKTRFVGQGMARVGAHIPLVGSVIGVVGAIVDRVAKEKEDDPIKAAAKLFTDLATLDQETENAARELSYRYEQQIKELTVQGAETLAECGARRFVDYIRAGKINDEESLTNHLIQAVSCFDSYQGVLPFTHKALEVFRAKQQPWSDQGVFQETAIKAEDSHIYIKSSPEGYHLYGYRLGTLEEVEELGYQKHL